MDRPRGPSQLTGALNSFLDSLPRSRVGVAGRSSPAFRACGEVGFHLAVVFLFLGGVLVERSLLVLTTLAAVCAGSFFGWSYLRRAITGQENLVLLEHAWLVMAASGATLWLLGLPLLAYFDVVAPALCVFLAAGRVGCLLVGCCHGRPSGFGITYPHELAADGFSEELVGIRLFPVQAIEAAGLAAIAVSGLAILVAASPGSALVWCAAAYSVVRFGLEGVRGDERRQWLGLSINRWMCITQLALALWVDASLVAKIRPELGELLAAAVGTVLVVALVLIRRFDQSRKVVSRAHLEEVSDLVRRKVEIAAAAPRGSPPLVSRTSLGVAAAVSRAAGDGEYHVSISLPDHRADLALLSRIVAGSLAGPEPSSVVPGQNGTLHCLARGAFAPGGEPQNWRVIYAMALRRLPSSRRVPTGHHDTKGLSYFDRPRGIR